MWITNKHVFFWGGIFGNWNEVKGGITISKNGKTITFPTSEHLFMWLKAIFFEDYDTADEITRVDSPKEAKKLGRKVKGFTEEAWEKERESAMYQAISLRLQFDKVFKKELLSPKYSGKTFVEASPFDKIWGIGMRETDQPEVDSEENWKGLNLLGKLLTKLRDEETKP